MKILFELYLLVSKQVTEYFPLSELNKLTDDFSLAKIKCSSGAHLMGTDMAGFVLSLIKDGPEYMVYFGPSNRYQEEILDNMSFRDAEEVEELEIDTSADYFKALDLFTKKLNKLIDVKQPKQPKQPVKLFFEKKIKPKVKTVTTQVQEKANGVSRKKITTTSETIKTIERDITICAFRPKKTSAFKIGLAIRNPKFDDYDKSRGRSVATGKALNKPLRTIKLEGVDDREARPMIYRFLKHEALKIEKKFPDYVAAFKHTEH